MNGSEVMVHKKGDSVVLEPIRRAEWPQGYFKKITITDSTFKRPNQGKTPPVRTL